MRRKRRVRARAPLGFSNERFLELLADLTGITPVGELGRDTPLDLSSLEAARGTLLLREVFSKYDDGKPSPEKSSTTWNRFHEAEGQCLMTNKHFYETANRNPFWIGVRRRIWSALGVFNWDTAAKYFAFGPGGTTRLTRKKAPAAYKYSGVPESTSGNAVLASCAISMIPLWKQSVQISAEEYGITDLVLVVPGNSVIAVPKNYRTFRTIAKEPCMNIYIQKGIGRYIRKCLYQVGVNLDDQTRNQYAAFLGSVDGLLATVDLSMASDTLSYEVVSWLLPNDWWWALEQCRSPIGVLPSGEKINYQKFSSMGNGYTFELESLIFWAITQQVCRPNVEEKDPSVLVFGDDIIVPSVHYNELSTRLQEAGFTLNLKKSFAEGPYRESCGKHYYSGADVTPFYVRKAVDELDRLFLVHNNVYRWGCRTGIDVRDLCEKLRRLAPAKWREPRLPDGFGDGAFIGAVDELRLDSHPHGWECWQVSVLARSQRELADDLPVGQLIASLNAQSARRPIVKKELLRTFSVRSRSPEWAVEQFLIDEGLCGLPAMEGPVREIKICVRRHPLVS